MRNKISGGEVIERGRRISMGCRHHKRDILSGGPIRCIQIARLDVNRRLDGPRQGRVLDDLAQLADIIAAVIVVRLPDVQ